MKKRKKALNGEEIDPITGKPIPQLKPGPDDPNNITWKLPSDIFNTPPIKPVPQNKAEEDMFKINTMPVDPTQVTNIPGIEAIAPEAAIGAKILKQASAVPATLMGIGMQLLNAWTKEKIHSPVVRPQLVYNDRAGGTGSQAIYDDGGEVNASPTDIQLFDGGAKPISSNNFLGDTFEFVGPSHEEGGINIGFGGKKIEVEGGETAFVDRDGTLQIMGNMVVPGTRQKFKNAIKSIAREEEKMNRKKSMADELLKGLNSDDPMDRLAIAAAGVNKHAADKVHANLAAKKTSLANLQKAILEEAERVKADPKKVALGKARKGASVTGDPEPDERVAKKFKALQEETTRRLQAMYPGKKVEVLMNRERDIRTQRGLKGRGTSQTSVSVHNFGGASDFTIKVDGKVLSGSKKDGTLDVYKNTLQAAAKEMGMYHVGDWDPFHISLVQEGKGKTWSTLFSQYPELKQTKRYQDSLAYLKQMVDSGQADADELRTYNFLTGSKSKVKAKNHGNYSQFVLPDSKAGKWIGENFFEDDPSAPNQFTPFGSGTPGPGGSGNSQKKTGAPPVYQGDFDITAPTKKPKTSNVEGLKLTQILPELVSQVTNTVDPVWMQQFTPEYLQPFQITLQDQINENNATFRGLERLIDDPAVLSLLQGQTQQNNQKVLGEQFRINQANEADVINRNTNTFNDALMKNLGLADQQYVRQSTAKSKTRSQNNEILNSLAAKELQHSISMKKLAAWENMYDYRLVDSNNDGIADSLDYQGPDAHFDFQGMGSDTPARKNSETVTLDQYGVPVRTQRKSEDIVPTTRINISKKGENGASVSSLYTALMKKFR